MKRALYILLLITILTFSTWIVHAESEENVESTPIPRSAYGNIWEDDAPPYLYPNDIIAKGCSYANICGTYHSAGVVSPLATGGFVIARYGSELVPKRELDLLYEYQHKILHQNWLVYLDDEGQVVAQHPIEWLSNDWFIEAIAPSEENCFLRLFNRKSDSWAIALVNSQGEGGITLQLPEDIYVQSAAPAPQGGWLLFGTQKSPTQWRAWAGLVGSDGTMQWTHVGEATEKPYPEEHASYVYCWADETDFFVLSVTWQGYTRHGYRFVKLNSEGLVLQENKLNSIDPAIMPHRGLYPVWAHDQLLILLFDDSSGGLNKTILCLNASGELLWQKEFPALGIPMALSKGYALITVDEQGYEKDFVLLNRQGEIICSVPFGKGALLSSCQIMESADQSIWIFGGLLNERDLAIKLHDNLWD